VREFPNVLFEITDTLGQQIGQTMSRDRQFASGFQKLIITGEIRCGLYQMSLSRVEFSLPL
jgi:hypothetical protein